MERPILMSGPMVRAILAGQKTQTRRVMKNPDHNGCTTGDCPHTYQAECDAGFVATCPHGVPGDRLWVRETWTANRDRAGEWDRDSVLYRADPMYDGCKPGDFAWNWAPSIHMPRWASRLTLEITEVRVQRLQEISDDDAQAEGVDEQSIYAGDDSWGSDHGGVPTTFIPAFRMLWDSINANRGYGWDANPWVWAITFEVVK